MEVQFQKIAGDDGEISLDEFKDALNLKKVLESVAHKYIYFVKYNNHCQRWQKHSRHNV